MEKILSIIIPSYNTSEYIDTCLPTFLSDEKILNDIELLIVNDGSKDDTLKKAKEFEKRYPNAIKVIDKENGGHGSTINSGIKFANGKYFKVVDGDDWVDNNNLANLVQQLKKIEVDMVVNPYIEYNEKKQSQRIISRGGQYKGEKLFEELTLEEAIPMHSLTYKTSILNEHQISLDENAFYVDVEYILFPIPFIKTVYFFDYPVYVYRYDTPNQSVSTKSTQKNVLHHLKVVNSVLKFYDKLPENTGLNAKEYIHSRLIRLVNTQYNIYFSFPISKEIKKEISEFDSHIRKQHPKIYTSKGYNPFVRLYRNSSGFYFFIWSLNQIRLKLR